MSEISGICIYAYKYALVYLRGTRGFGTQHGHRCAEWEQDENRVKMDWTGQLVIDELPAWD